MSTNPFDDSRPPSRPRPTRSARLPSSASRGPADAARSGHAAAPPAAPPSKFGEGDGEPIWAARNVEWPIPSALSIANFQKLQRASRQAGSQLGIEEVSFATSNSTSSGHAAVATTVPPAGKKGDNSSQIGGGSSSATAAAVEKLAAANASAAAESSYFSGFMSRVLNPTSTTAADQGTDHSTNLSSGSSVVSSMANSSNNNSNNSRPLRPPRAYCVATANSWMVAALECPMDRQLHLTSPAHGHAGKSSVATSAGILRLISRWNVRRTSGSVDNWMALPPPVAGGDGRIRHVFVDPTGCHTLISAQNGELYYHHSSLRVVHKLAGFGRNADGTWPTSKELTGVSATMAVHAQIQIQQQSQSKVAGPGSPSGTMATISTQIIQVGISAGSYVTSVAWDRELGTEGSTKKILLGTSTGEIYEYALLSPSATTSGVLASGAASSSGSVGSGSEDLDAAYAQPVLLHQLNSDAAVTGLAFERLRTGLLILCCTSGRNKRTRFYTFFSTSSMSFRRVLADETYASLVELPGSVDHAELRLCNDHVCMRTATGIYYGTIDRDQSGPAFAGGSMMIESGILQYDVSGGLTPMPISLALTPHHIITLSDRNEVCFLNRVSQTVIQKERIDWMPQSSSPVHLDESHMVVGELMMDVRRPDQVWLRKARSLVHISPSQEDRDVWKFTLYKCLEMPTRAIAARANVGRSYTSSKGISSSVMSEDVKAQESLFEQAKSLCTNPSQEAVVTAVRAEYHLQQGRGELAAKYFAQCPSVLEPFADTAIRLALPALQIDDPHSYGGSASARASLKSNAPLITFLSDKMRVAKNDNDRMTCTMLGAWLTELYLHERDSTSDGTSLSAKRALSQFLSSNVHNMDAKTVMKVLSSHDVSASECAAYAASSGDIASAVNAALRVGPGVQEGVQDALRILNDAPFEQSETLYYKYASTLLARAPVQAGKSFLARYVHGLSPTRLLPSIMHYERLRSDRVKAEKIAQAAQRTNPFADISFQSDGGKSRGFEETKSVGIGDDDGVEIHITASGVHGGIFVDDATVSTRYLEGVITLGCRSSAIYSFLISLYVKLKDEEPLFKFLSSHVPAAAAASNKPDSGFDAGHSGPLDMSYALRTILATGRHFRSAIKLYMGFGMRHQAVELALKVDPSLARELAQDSVELDERKQLWLMIAKYAASEVVNIGEVDVVSNVVSVLRDCGPDVLSIEDVLPFLPDFAQIDEIKDEICEALTSYSSKIEGYLKEMNEYDKKCGALRDEIARLRNHHMQIKADARCAYTNKKVVMAGEPFYVFPSGYVSTESALMQEVMPYLNERQRLRVEEIQGDLKRMGTKARRMGSKYDRLQTELDGLIAAECPLTGTIMIESIDREFEGCNEFDDTVQGGGNKATV